jgi:hypothetical protein
MAHFSRSDGLRIRDRRGKESHLLALDANRADAAMCARRVNFDRHVNPHFLFHSSPPTAAS